MVLHNYKWCMHIQRVTDSSDSISYPNTLCSVSPSTDLLYCCQGWGNSQVQTSSNGFVLSIEEV